MRQARLFCKPRLRNRRPSVSYTKSASEVFWPWEQSLLQHLQRLEPPSAYSQTIFGHCLRATCGAVTLGLMGEVTRILSAIDKGDTQAAEELLPLVYAELRRLAAQ